MPPFASRQYSPILDEVPRDSDRSSAPTPLQPDKPYRSPVRFRARLAIALFPVLFAAAAAAPAEPDMPSQRFRIQIQEGSVYKVEFAQLEVAGLSGPVPSARLALANLGQPVAMRVDDGGDDSFDPGDALVFVGEHLRGESTHYHDYSPFNVYVLYTGARAAPVRMREAPVMPADVEQRAPAGLTHDIHLEQDLLRVALSGPSGHYDDEALWYWKQLNHLASLPTEIPVDLSRIDSEAETPFELKIQFRGWSDSASAAFLPVPDHVVEVALNGTRIADGRWQGRDTHLIEIPRIPLDLVREQGNVIQIRVPSRLHADNSDPLVDVVYLDWIQASFPRDAVLDGDQARLTVPAGRNTGLLRLEMERGLGEAGQRKLELFGDDGSTAVVTALSGATDASVVFEAPIPDSADRFWVVPDGRFRRPPAITLDRPSALAETTGQRDYFIITHASLAEAVRPLAVFHERNGTRTELVDVQDIYDEFNFGIKHPRAIRDFLAHARKFREAPAPRLVLLVGDASWFNKEPADASADAARYSDRDLIPTWQLRSRDGPAASDNPFVTLVGDDLHPDMAIGRFPAAGPEELGLMVDKTVAYMENRTPGAWRSRVTLVSDSTGNFAARNVQLADLARSDGMIAEELLADPAEDGEMHQRSLRSALDDGMLVLHFFGHGGRFMWQTAPSRGDAGNLFDMEDLDLLSPSDRLPIVLSMSCATGPFDHPAADSLAEKFLRVQGRGAVAVVAASARNSPSVLFTNRLLDGLVGSSTLGEAFRAAKHVRQHPDSALFYNLFGDPALVPARPEGVVALEIVGRRPLEVRALLPFDDFAGHAAVEWRNDSGEPILDALAVDSSSISLTAPKGQPESGNRRVNIYVWDPSTGRDAAGTLVLDPEQEVPE